LPLIFRTFLVLFTLKTFIVSLHWVLSYMCVVFCMHNFSGTCATWQRWYRGQRTCVSC